MILFACRGPSVLYPVNVVFWNRNLRNISYPYVFSQVSSMFPASKGPRFIMQI